MVANISIKQLLYKALTGNDITIEEANMLISPNLTDLNELIQASNTITHHFFNKKIEMCAIYPAKVGRCSGDCAFCAQSAYHKSNVMPVSVRDQNDNEIIANANEFSSLGVKRYSLVTSGEHLTDKEFDRILHIFHRLHDETEIELCASLGSLTLERANRLRDAGISRYHHNIETSRSFFHRICSTHTYDDKIVTLNIARQSGLKICCGGIISMGETPEQRVEMAFALRELNVDCVPINILNPIPGTRLENQQSLSIEEILRTIAVFRFILKDKSLRFAGGREKALGQNEYLGYTAGINSLIVGNYLITSGKSFKQEISNLEMAGLEL